MPVRQYWEKMAGNKLTILLLLLQQMIFITHAFFGSASVGALSVRPKRSLFDSMFPGVFPGDVTANREYIPVNETLVITCRVLSTYENYTELNSTYMYFKLKQNVLHSEEINKDTIQYTVDRVGFDDEGSYYCYMNESSLGKTEKKILSRVDIDVGILPQLPDKLDCVSRNFEDLVCSGWCPSSEQEGKVVYRLDYTASLLGVPFPPGINGFIPAGQCPVYLNESTGCGCYFCRGNSQTDYFKECSGKNTFEPFKLTYNMMLNATSDYGNSLRNYTVFASTHLVKPNIVRSVVLHNITSSSVMVHITCPDRYESYPLIYRLVVYSGTSKDKTVHQNITNKNDFECFDMQNGPIPAHMSVDGLHPYTEYTLAAYVKPPIGGFWSDASEKILTTKEAAPGAAPELPGAYRCKSESDCSEKTIFWKGIPEDKQHGVIIEQKLCTDSGSTSCVSLSAFPRHKQIQTDGDMTTFGSLQVFTKAGGSPPGNITLPGAAQRPMGPVKVEAEYDANRTVIMFRWERPQDVQVYTYTLFRCVGKSENPHSCNNGVELEYSILPETRRDYRLSNHSDDSDWVYGLFLTDTQGVSSAMAPNWICIFDDKKAPSAPVLRQASSQAERELHFEWDLLICQFGGNRAKVEEYILMLQEKGAPESEKNITLSPDTSAYKVKDLKPGTEYIAYITAVAKGGIGVSGMDNTYTTSLSRPDDAPSAVGIDTITSDSFKVYWQPPKLPNGFIVEYNIIIKDDEKLELRLRANDTECLVTSLDGFVNYSVRVQAVNSAGVSPWSDQVYATTRIRAPAQVQHLRIKLIGGAKVQMKWASPQPQNGPIHHYRIDTKSSPDQIIHFTINGTLNNIDKPVPVFCDGTNINIPVYFSISAATVDETGHILFGEPSEEETIVWCLDDMMTIHVKLESVSLDVYDLPSTGCPFLKSLQSAKVKHPHHKRHRQDKRVGVGQHHIRHKHNHRSRVCCCAHHCDAYYSSPLVYSNDDTSLKCYWCC